MEESSFFNDVDGDRIYYAEDFAEYFIPFFTNGIFNNGCQVLGNTNDMAVNVSTGRAFINGYRYRNKQSKTLTIENADGVLSRIDNIVIRLDLTNRNISTQVIKGSFSNNPVAPDLTRTSTIYDLRIAKVYIPAGTTEITQDLIEDCRFINNDCGNVISPIKTPDTEQLFIQMQAIFDKFIADSTNGFDTWFDSIKNQLDSDAAGNLQNQINNLNSNKVDNAKYDLDSKNLELLANGKNVGDSVHIPTGITDTTTGEEDLKIVNNKGVVKFSLEGKTEQKTYTGKNLLNYVDNLQSISGLTNTLNPDGSITTAGKPTADYTRIVKNYDITNLLEDKQVYTISQEKLNRKVFIQISAKKKDGTYTYYDSSTGKLSFTVDKSLYTNYSIVIQTPTMSIWGDESLTITNKYMLCKGTDTADSSFEPYVGETASPNPDYPQEIENIKGAENLLNLPDGTYTDNGVTAVVKGGIVTLNGTATANSFINIPFDYTFLANKNYTLSANNVSTLSGDNYVRLNYGTAVYFPIRLSSVNAKYTSNFNENTTVNTCVIRTESGKTYNNFVIKPMLEEGSIPHDFVLPGTNYLQLENKSKNILPHSLSQGSWNTTSTNTRVANYSNILIKPGTYTFSTDIDLTNYVVWVGTSTQKFPHLNWNKINEIKSWSAIEKITFTIEKESYFLVMYRKKDDSTITPDEIKNIKQQLKIGSEAGEFEPYQKKIINIDLKGNKLCSNKDKTIKDDLIIENGIAKIYKKFSEYTFTGNETFSFADKGARIMSNTGRISQLKNVYIPTPQSSSNITPSFCTHYTVDGQGNVVKVSNKFGFSQYDNDKFIYFPADYSTIDEFKAKLKSLYDAGTPVIIQYPLAEPEVIELGKVDFELLEGNSTLNLEEDLKSNMSIKYYTDSTVVDLKKKVENKQNVILHGTTVPSNDLGEDGDIYLQHN